MEGAIIFLAVAAIASLIGWAIRQGQTEQIQSEDRESVRSMEDVEVKFDKFQNETTLTWGSRFPGNGPPYKSIVVMTSHPGETPPPGFNPGIIVLVSSGMSGSLAIINSKSPVILLVDGIRMQLGPVTGLNPTWSCRGAISLGDLAKVSRAACVEGQGGAVEFSLTPEQRAGLAKIVAHFEGFPLTPAVNSSTKSEETMTM